jgi:1-acyl-sn-glycerol-3-phosphate acyltransferase
VKTIVGVAYGLYAWLLFLVCVMFAVLFALLVPGLTTRRRWVSTAARWPFHLAGIRTTVTGVDHLPAGHCIVVANHASYADGVILQAFLPPRFGYVIKGEMQNVPIVHFVLRRLGSRFVERFATSGSARDARTLLKAAADGESLAFFPEGTFLQHPGLDRFRPGAFAAAIKGELPVVPVVIRGSRKLLPAKTILPRHAHLSVDILEPIPASDPAFAASVELAELARQRILAVLDEPDLLAENAA